MTYFMFCVVGRLVAGPISPSQKPHFHKRCFKLAAMVWGVLISVCLIFAFGPIGVLAAIAFYWMNKKHTASTKCKTYPVVKI